MVSITNGSNSIEGENVKKLDSSINVTLLLYNAV